MFCSRTRREENIENIPIVNATFIRYGKAWKQPCMVSKCLIFNLTSWAQCRRKNRPSLQLWENVFKGFSGYSLPLSLFTAHWCVFLFIHFFISMDLLGMNVGNRLAAALSLCNSEVLPTENISSYLSQVA